MEYSLNVDNELGKKTFRLTIFFKSKDFLILPTDSIETTAKYLEFKLKDVLTEELSKYSDMDYFPYRLAKASFNYPFLHSREYSGSRWMKPELGKSLVSLIGPLVENFCGKILVDFRTQLKVMSEEKQLEYKHVGKNDYSNVLQSALVRGELYITVKSNDDDHYRMATCVALTPDEYEKWKKEQ